MKVSKSTYECLLKRPFLLENVKEILSDPRLDSIGAPFKDSIFLVYVTKVK